MATYEYARIWLTTNDDAPMTVKVAAGIPADDGSVVGMDLIDALNSLGARGWRPLHMQDLKGVKDATAAEAWHLVRSSDDKVG
ncbi:hypothetical protein [Promicromonospora sukumoe]